MRFRRKAKRFSFSPQISFPPEVAETVEAAYGRAEAILEYGSGGSTVLAARLGKRVFAVESDREWAAATGAWIAEHHPQAPVRVVHADIGPTGEWGKPYGPERMADFYRYPMAIWDDPEFRHPDVILIDGRFRLACICTALLRIERETLVLFDDYAGRLDYHQIERLVKPVRTVERMAVFELSPGRVPPAEWTWVIGAFLKTTYTHR